LILKSNRIKSNRNHFRGITAATASEDANLQGAILKNDLGVFSNDLPD
jgi:hypothetical protein